MTSKDFDLPKALNEKYIVVIENSFDGKLREVPFRMKFPIDIRWEEMIDGNFISANSQLFLSVSWWLSGLLGALIGSVWNYAVSATLVWRRK